MQGEGRDAWGCAGMHSVGWGGGQCSPGACAPDTRRQPWHWGEHEMIVSLVPAGLWVLKAPPVPSQV